MFDQNLANKYFMHRSFYAGDLFPGPLFLSEKESYHLCVTSRARVSEKICVLNGRGLRGNGTLVSADRKQAVVEVFDIENIKRATPSITLIQATITNSNNDYIVREATAIGVERIIFFEARNSECQLKNKLPEKFNRWQSIATEACKQSGNAFLPQFLYFQALEDIELSEFEIKIFGGLSETAQPLGEVLSQNRSAEKFCIAIGPEGDFSSFEYDFMRKKSFLECKFSRNILRSETAAIYALSVIDQFFAI